MKYLLAIIVALYTSTTYGQWPLGGSQTDTYAQEVRFSDEAGRTAPLPASRELSGLASRQLQSPCDGCDAVMLQARIVALEAELEELRAYKQRTQKWFADYGEWRTFWWPVTEVQRSRRSILLPRRTVCIGGQCYERNVYVPQR